MPVDHTIPDKPGTLVPFVAGAQHEAAKLPPECHSRIIQHIEAALHRQNRHLCCGKHLPSKYTKRKNGRTIFIHSMKPARYHRFTPPVAEATTQRGSLIRCGHLFDRCRATAALLTGTVFSSYREIVHSAGLYLLIIHIQVDRTTLNSHILLVECPDEQGLISRITGVLFRHDFNIESNHEFVDRTAGRFFMRTEFVGAPEAGPAVKEIESLLPQGARVRLAHRGDRKLVVLVTKEHHCLAELLIRHAYGELGASIEAVIGNHSVLAPLSAKFGVPFYHVPYEDRPVQKAEAEIQEVLSQYDPDYIVLAKFMRILTPEFIAQYPNRIINIHHSFLPAFVGAKPYQQAFERGVKIIGATAHFTTTDLDEGPIISQSVLPVHHSHSPEDMAQAGRDIEKLVLARALKLILEERVFLSGRRTIVFD